jgi:hypothetical protein
VTVYASRYAIEGRLAEPRELTPTDLERVPGSHDDALHAVRSIPGLASNASGRPYIRGSLSEDVLVRYDGIPLLDPFHLKNFQSLISAIDPAGIERIEVFSGGFPVRYGTRSGGVIDITAPSFDSGHEYRASLSLISAGVSTIGTSERWPLEWLGAVRHSTLDLLDPVEDGFGEPQFSDTLGRLRWVTARGAWTAGWLLLDDRLELGAPDDEELRWPAIVTNTSGWRAITSSATHCARARVSSSRRPSADGKAPCCVPVSPRARSTKPAASMASTFPAIGLSPRAIAPHTSLAAGSPRLVRPIDIRGTRNSRRP